MKDSGVSPIPSEFTPAEVLPHAGPMVLLDEILDCGDDRVIAAATIKPSSLFLNAANRVPAWIGLEYMAQCIAAWEGINAKQREREVEVGYLVATRRYRATGQGFILGDRLEVTAHLVQHEGALAVFECAIMSQHCTVKGTVSVYRSPTPAGLTESGE